MFAVALIVLAFAVLGTFLCCFAVFLQEAFAGDTYDAQSQSRVPLRDRLLDRVPSSAVGSLQPTAAVTFSI
ncbi:MAG: hypothetical protein U0805_09685 [Pirellulales bacterium]